MSDNVGRRPDGPGDEILYDGPCQCGQKHCDRHITLYADGFVEIEDADNYIAAQLPDGVLTKPVAAPEPDWSKAPEWAMWTTVDATGMRQWWGNEPPGYSILHATWINGEYPGKYATGGHEELPLGVDWRTTLRKRPEVGDE